VAAWVGTQASERKERDRFALLKAVAEQPSENAARVLELLREHDRARAERKEREERRGYLVGGATTIAVGIGLAVMLQALSAKDAVWTVALIPGLIGVVLTGAGLLMKRQPRA
jgi:hypothetical protein